MIRYHIGTIFLYTPTCVELALHDMSADLEDRREVRYNAVRSDGLVFVRFAALCREVRRYAAEALKKLPADMAPAERTGHEK